MRLLLAAVSICLLSSCAGLADSIRKHNQKKQIYQQYSAKYYAACQKEAFNYYPVAIVTQTKTRKNIIEPTKTASCTKWGNTVNCRDTTIDLSGLSGAGKTTTTSYDANAGSRNNHIKSCIDSNLRNDSQFIRATNSVNAGYHKAGSNYIPRKASPPPTVFLVLVGSEEINESENSSASPKLACFYGDSRRKVLTKNDYCDAWKRLPKLANN